MESQYYTPEIEEFHNGFEFEWFDNQFKKQSFGITTDDDLEIIEDEIRERKIRVKYLDREDVESFGWNQIEYDSYKLGSFIFEFNNQYKTFIYLENNNENVFVGNIKNKSELQKIMIQTGIINK